MGGIPADAPALPLEEVRAGERYAIIMSTCAGLWRYHIGDTIRFTSLAPWPSSSPDGTVFSTVSRRR